MWSREIGLYSDLHPWSALSTRLQGDGGNDDSINFGMVNFSGPSFLFTGDLEAPGEGQMVTALSRFYRVDVLKAKHHGSKGSSRTSEFLEHIA